MQAQVIIHLMKLLELIIVLHLEMRDNQLDTIIMVPTYSLHQEVFIISQLSLTKLQNHNHMAHKSQFHQSIILILVSSHVSFLMTKSITLLARR